jgi:enamine deaminase RidA (YjgF/YER057c/UK114 family)
MTIERFGTTTYGHGDVRHVPFVRAGHWVFGTGLRANLANGLMDPAVVRAGRPFGAPPQAEREAASIFQRMGAHLEQAGSALAQVARLDQYYGDPRSVDPYHAVRKKVLAGQVAPSTSVIVGGLLNPGAAMDVQVIAATRASGYRVEPAGQASLSVPRTSGYAPCVRVGDLVFIAGQLARDASGELAAEAQMPPGQLWNGTRIQLETGYLVRHRLMPALAAAGSSLDLVLKAQVYLTHADDFPAFWQVWSEAFGGSVPPTTVVPVSHPAFGTSAATIEVNLVAAHESARGRVKDIRCDVELIGPEMSPARTLDGILFVAGLMALEGGGLCRSAQADPSAPYYVDSACAQMADIQRKAATIFEAAGTDLSNVVRVLQFQSDLGDFHRIFGAWDASLRRAGLPFNAVQVAPDLVVPGARLIVDLWGHVPAP